MSDAFKALDGDRDKHVIVNFDPAKLVELIDLNSDGLIDRKEFYAHFEHPLYYLVLEEVLTKPFTKLNRTMNSPLNYLFPSENSTIGEEEITLLLGKLDIDGSGTISRKEISQVFQANKNWAFSLFLDRIDRVQRALNLQTN